MDPLRIRVVVYPDDEWWIIHGLDYEFSTLARRLKDVPGEIRRWLSVLFAACQELGVEPPDGTATLNSGALRTPPCHPPTLSDKIPA